MNSLPSLARRINGRVETIQGLKTQSLDKAKEALAEILLQGKDLLRAKAAIPYGHWLPWLSQHCPAVCAREAQRYMRLASDTTRVSQLLDAGSLRGALALLDDEQPQSDPSKQTRSWPPYIEALGRVGKVITYMEKCPIGQWPNEGRDRLRDKLLPVARELWPQRFDDCLTQ